MPLNSSITNSLQKVGQPTNGMQGPTLGTLKFQPSWEDKAFGWLEPVAGLVSDFGQWMGGTPARNNQLPTQTPMQQQFGQSRMQNYMNMPQPTFDPIEKFARENFQSKTLPSILNRLSRLGGMNTSGGRQMATDSTARFENELAAQKAQWEQLQRNQSAREAMAAFGQPAFDTEHIKEKEGMGWPLMMAALSAFTGGGEGMALGSIVKLLEQLLSQGNAGSKSSDYGSSFSVPNEQIERWKSSDNMPDYLSALGYPLKNR